MVWDKRIERQHVALLEQMGYGEHEDDDGNTARYQRLEVWLPVKMQLAAMGYKVVK
jgi:hypothetical protein